MQIPLIPEKSHFIRLEKPREKKKPKKKHTIKAVYITSNNLKASASEYKMRQQPDIISLGIQYR